MNLGIHVSRKFNLDVIKNKFDRIDSRVTYSIKFIKKN